MSDGLVEFLRARYDEEAQEAEAAAAELGAEWYYDSQGFVASHREYGAVATGSQDYLEPERGVHIARHDPARVLREIDAKRQLLDDVLPSVRDADASIEGEWSVGSDIAGAFLRALALPYADHPDYQDGWKP